MPRQHIFYYPEAGGQVKNLQDKAKEVGRKNAVHPRTLCTS